MHFSVMARLWDDETGFILVTQTQKTLVLPQKYKSKEKSKTDGRLFPLERLVAPVRPLIYF